MAFSVRFFVIKYLILNYIAGTRRENRNKEHCNSQTTCNLISSFNKDLNKSIPFCNQEMPGFAAYLQCFPTLKAPTLGPCCVLHTSKIPLLGA